MFRRSIFFATLCVCCLGALAGQGYGGGRRLHGNHPQSRDGGPEETLDQKVQRLAYDGNLPDGVHFMTSGGKSVGRRNVESFARWGEDLRSVAAVVVKVPAGEAGGTIGVDGLREMLKIDAYKKNLFRNPEGTWHLGEWSGKDSVALYVIEQWRHSSPKVWKADNLDTIVGDRHFMQMPDDKPVRFVDLAHNAMPPFNKKVIPARDVNRVRNELWEDREFAAKCKAAYDAAKNIQGDIASKPPVARPDPPLFPELAHLDPRNTEARLQELAKRAVARIDWKTLEKNLSQRILLISEIDMTLSMSGDRGKVEALLKKMEILQGEAVSIIQKAEYKESDENEKLISENPGLFQTYVLQQMSSTMPRSYWHKLVRFRKGCEAVNKHGRVKIVLSQIDGLLAP